jgi:hypothetical protein
MSSWSWRPPLRARDQAGAHAETGLSLSDTVMRDLVARAGLQNWHEARSRSRLDKGLMSLAGVKEIKDRRHRIDRRERKGLMETVVG